MSALVLGRPAEVMHTIWAAQMADPAERSFAEKHRISREDFLRRYDGADVVGVEVDGQLAGGMFFISGAVHIGILPQYRSRWARSLKPMFERGFALHGSPLLARVGAYNRGAQAFVERIGCEKLDETALYIDYAAFQERMCYGFTR